MQFSITLNLALCVVPIFSLLNALLYVLLGFISYVVFYVFCSFYAFMNVPMMPNYALTNDHPLFLSHVIVPHFELVDYI